MNSINVTRAIRMPDLLRVGRYSKAPELGPHILFFSGGSALNQLSQKLKLYTHNSVHMVTPFDSGGSSAVLRKTFQMPSIGDLRSRLMALADDTLTGQPEVYQLFNHRLNKNTKNAELLTQLDAMCAGKDDMIRAIPNPMRRLIRTQLGYFREAMPTSFNLRAASIGNLILTGGYLNNHQHLDPIIFLFSKLVGVLGTVRATVNDNLSLGADLADGTRIIGQHRLTGKEHKPLTSPIKKIFLSTDPQRLLSAKAKLRKKNRKLITNAELICYPPGSFYTSLIANLLPEGVGKAIASNDCPKVYIPNLGQDPEQIGMTMDLSIRTLLDYLRVDAGLKLNAGRFINFILMDSRYQSPLNKPSSTLLNELGIQLIDTRLVSKSSAPRYDPELLIPALLSLT